MLPQQANVRFLTRPSGGQNVKGKTRFVWPIVVLGLLLLSPALQVAAKPAAQPAGHEDGHYYFGFEQSTKPWASVADVGSGPSLIIEKGDNGCADMFGGLINTHYARLSSAPVTDATRPSIPATWMVAGLPAGFGEYFVRVQWSARLDNKAPVTSGAGDQAPMTCKTCNAVYAVAYLGSAPPQEGTQLKIANGKTPLANSWRSYEYTEVVESGGKGFVYVALGWNGIDSSIGIDCVDVTMTPILAAPPAPTNN
jgi:hypothetical protein